MERLKLSSTGSVRITRPVTAENSKRNGCDWHPNYPFEDHDWADAWIDGGPSPAGNPGPYFKVPLDGGDTVHRIYCIYMKGFRVKVEGMFRLCEVTSLDCTTENGCCWIIDLAMPTKALMREK